MVPLSLLPSDVVKKRKMPFYMPLERRFGVSAFRDLIEDTLSERAVRSRGLFEPEAVAKLRQMMLGGEFMHVKQVFSLMMLELWFRMAVDRRAAA